MAKIMIHSDPYKEEVKFQEWDEEGDFWNDILENSSSKLLGTEIRKGFFPFTAAKIVDTIIEEYGPETDDIDLIFEGSSDEYQELQYVCIEKKVRVSLGENYLDNAREITNDIKKIFNEVKLLAKKKNQWESEGLLQKELQRFADAANDDIPICIFGNYSSGKSTFINSLIGYELLPSGDDPTSARVCRISKSSQPDMAIISFGYNEIEYSITFTVAGFNISPSVLPLDISQKFTELLDITDNTDIKGQVHDVLCMLNEYANGSNGNGISDLIKVEFPFDGSEILSKNDFVIFDSPGANSASNEKHYEVLKNALENMSNGLPIFIASNDTLDSLDNVKLYEEFRRSDNLDERFTMIIINKADQASVDNIKSEMQTVENGETLTQ